MKMKHRPTGDVCSKLDDIMLDTDFSFIDDMDFSSLDSKLNDLMNVDLPVIDELESFLCCGDQRGSCCGRSYRKA